MAYYLSITDQQILFASSCVTTFIGGAMFILGTIGNTANVFALSCLKVYRSLATSAFLATASFSAQVYLTFALLVPALSNLLGYNVASVSMAACRCVNFLTRVSVEVTLTCLCLASLDRYLMTSRSARLRSLITLWYARLMICLCIIIWLCASIPSALYVYIIPYVNVCIPAPGYATTVTYLNLIFAVFLPVIILCVFGLLTWRNLGHTRLTSLNKQVTKMILLDIIVVFISNIPFAIFLIYAVTNSSNRLFTSIETLSITIVQVIAAVQPAGSFYFYLMVSPAYRNNIKNMFRIIFCFWKPRPTNRLVPTVGTASAMAEVAV